MNSAISEKVQRWSAEEQGDVDFNALYALIEFLASRRFNEYSPTFGPHPNFRSRLASWLDNSISDEEQKLLFRLIPYVFFMGRDEIAALQRSTFRIPIIRWIIEQAGLRFDDRDLNAKLTAEIQQTWFCRPDWRSYAAIHSGDSTELLAYITSGRYKRVVLTEDLVASGSQMSDLEPLFSHLPATLPILLAPLIVCPKGVETGNAIAGRHPQITFSPGMPLPDNAFVSSTRVPGEPDFFAEIRALAVRIHSVVCDNLTPPPNAVPYGPFGFRGTGAMIVMYSNTPDNTLPLIHHRSNSWKPLFPRRSRI
jgi:hypothetical protein